MAGATEELWFVNWEFKGMPWENPVNLHELVAEQFCQKLQYADAGDAGELDYRVPVDQSLQLYTALQRQQRRFEAGLFSRRRSLDSETAKFGILVQTGFGLVRKTSEPVRFCSSNKSPISYL